MDFGVDTIIDCPRCGKFPLIDCLRRQYILEYEDHDLLQLQFESGCIGCRDGEYFAKCAGVALDPGPVLICKCGSLSLPMRLLGKFRIYRAACRPCFDYALKIRETNRRSRSKKKVRGRKKR